MKKYIFLSIAILFSAGCGVNTSPGSSTKVGTIISMHKIGMIRETWEASIIRGGLNGGSGVLGQAFNFTIDDPTLVEPVTLAMRSGQEVEITYRTEGLYSSFRTESGGDFLTSIKTLKP